MRGNQPAQAERVFVEAVARHPGSARAYIALGTFYIASHEYDKAEDSLNQAFDLAPQNPMALYSLVSLYLASGQAAGVETLFQRSIDAGGDPLSLQLSLADLRIHQGRVEEALALLRQLKTEFPEARTVALRLARTLLNQGDREQGRGLIESLLASDPKDAEAHYLMGVAHVLEEKLDSALQEFERALELDQLLVAAHLNRASVLQRLGRLPQAEQALQKLLEIDRDNLVAGAKLAKVQALLGESPGQMENALLDAEVILEQLPSSFDALAARAEASLFLNRLEAARRDYRLLLQRQPENPFFLNRLGKIADLEGKPEEAIDYYRRVLEVFPDPDAMNQMAAILVREGREREALRELDRLGARTDRQELILMIKGRVYVAQKNYAEAERVFRKSIELNPNNYRGYIALAQLKMEQHNFDEAILEVDVLIALNDRYGPAYLQKGYYLQASKNPQAAMESYRRALDLLAEDSDGFASAANNLAWLSVQAGQDLTAAVTWARKARRHDPKNPDYADTLGWAYHHLGSHTLAVDQLLFSVNHGKPTPGHYYRLGMAYYKKGDTGHARDALQKSLAMSHSFEGAEEAKSTLATLEEDSRPGG